MAVIKTFDNAVACKTKAPAAGSAVPLRALQDRLRCPDGLGVPSWARFLPPALQQAAQASAATRQTELNVFDACTTAASKTAQGTLKEKREQPVAPVATAWWSGRVWQLSRSPQGCRDVQDVLDSPMSPAMRGALVAELRGHVAEGVRCPSGNYVLQKCISACEPASVQFVVDEIVSKGPEGVAQVARHKYGCRIVQRLLEILPASRIQKLCEALLVHASETCVHPYGNYAMQHLVEFGQPSWKSAVVAALEKHADSIGENRFLCAVVVKSMTFASRSDKVSLATAIRAQPGLLEDLAGTRHGRIATRLVAETMKAKHQDAAGAARCQEAALHGRSAYSAVLCGA